MAIKFSSRRSYREARDLCTKGRGAPRWHRLPPETPAAYSRHATPSEALESARAVALITAYISPPTDSEWSMGALYSNRILSCGRTRLGGQHTQHIPSSDEP